MIKLSIIAADATVLPLLEFFAQSNEVSLHHVWLADGASRVSASQNVTELPLCDSWSAAVESALEVDGLFVVGVTEETIIAAKQFLAGGTAPVFILTETEGDISALFQFMSVWQDAPNRVIPLFQSGVSGTFAIAEQKLGEPIQRITFHRQLAKQTNQKISLNDFDHALLQDLDWIQSLGNFSHVSTWLTGEHDDQAVEATLTLTGDSTPETKWTLSRSNDALQWQLFLYGEQQTLTVECVNQRSPRIRIGEHESALPVPNTAQADLLTAMRTALTAPPASRRSWMDVVRNGEVGAAARRSIVRKRTIPIHFEDASERSHFKSQMTAIGCGVLLWIMFGVIGVLTLASIVDPRDREFRSASAAGFVLHEKDFQTDSKEFNLDGFAITNAVAEQWSETTPVLIIEETGTDLDQLREQVVEQELISRNLREVDGKVVLRPLTGEWFENVLRGAWAIVFLPLAIILIAQAFLFVARPISDD